MFVFTSRQKETHFQWIIIIMVLLSVKLASRSSRQVEFKNRVIRWAKISLPKIAKTIEFCGDLRSRSLGKRPWETPPWHRISARQGNGTINYNVAWGLRNGAPETYESLVVFRLKTRQKPWFTTILEDLYISINHVCIYIYTHKYIYIYIYVEPL